MESQIDSSNSNNLAEESLNKAIRYSIYFSFLALLRGILILIHLNHIRKEENKSYRNKLAYYTFNCILLHDSMLCMAHLIATSFQLINYVVFFITLLVMMASTIKMMKYLWDQDQALRSQYEQGNDCKFYFYRVSVAASISFLLLIILVGVKNSFDSIIYIHNLMFIPQIIKSYAENTRIQFNLNLMMMMPLINIASMSYFKICPVNYFYPSKSVSDFYIILWVSILYIIQFFFMILQHYWKPTFCFKSEEEIQLKRIEQENKDAELRIREQFIQFLEINNFQLLTPSELIIEVKKQHEIQSDALLCSIPVIPDERNYQECDIYIDQFADSPNIIIEKRLSLRFGIHLECSICLDFLGKEIIRQEKFPIQDIKNSEIKYKQQKYQAIKYKEKEEKSVLKTKCNHIFHSKCFQEWFQLNQSCPICRQGFLSL